MDLQIALMLGQDGLVNGAVYGLLALALVLVFSVTRVIFIPQGEFVAFGALSLATLQAGRMRNVFDYDPLLKEIDQLAGDGPYETQEWLVKRIVTTCAKYSAIHALEIALRKSPVREDGGSLGLRLRMSEEAMSSLRAATQ